MSKKNKRIVISALSVIVLVIIDQITKYLAVTNLKGTEGIDIIKGVFKLFYLENIGAAFGTFKGMQIVLIIFTSLLTLLILYLWYKLPEDKKFNKLRVLGVFIVAGAVGNLIDRIVNQYVVDFLYFELIDFPVFNVADCYITCGEIVLFILLIFYYKDEDLKRIFPKKEVNLTNSDEKLGE